MRYVFGPWIFDTTRCLLQAEAIECELDPLSFKLLSYFINQEHRIVSREELIEQVWQQNFVDDNAINRAISDLRKQLKTNDYKAQIIKTHYRKGYSFQLQVTELDSTQNRQENTPQKSEDAHLVIANNVNDLDRAEEVNSPKSKILTTQKKPTHKNKTYLQVMLVALVIFISCLVYFSSVLTPTSIPTQIQTKQQTITAPSKAVIAKTNLKPLEYSEEVLSWEKGSYLLPIISKDKKLLSYTFRETDSDVYVLRIKNLETLKEYDLTDKNVNLDTNSNEDYFPLAWSSNQVLVYQLSNAMHAKKELKCEIWQVHLQDNVMANKHKKLYDCKTDELINADIVSASNQMLYTKYNYRGMADLAAIVSRNLVSGAEFQISSPNIDERGDYFVKVSNKEDRALFLRKQASGTQIFISDLDGSNQKKLVELDYYIASVNWDESDDNILWINQNHNGLVNYDLKTKQIKQEKINSDHSPGRKFMFNLLAKDHFIIATQDSNLSIDQIDLNSDKPNTAEFIDSNKRERNFVPFNKSSASIYLIEGQGNNSSIWQYEEGIRRKLFDFSIPDIMSLAISPDDSKLLIATKQKLYIYEVNSLTLTRSIDFTGTIKKASWPKEASILLAYAPSLKTYAWFYNLETTQLSKLTDSPIEKAILINDNNLLFLDKEFQLIKKNIATGKLSFIFQFSKSSEVVWNADENYIYYISANELDYIIKKPLTKLGVKEKFLLSKGKWIVELIINNQKENSILYINYQYFNLNYLIEMKLKTTANEGHLLTN